MDDTQNVHRYPPKKQYSMDSLTLGQLWKVLRRLKLSAVIAVLVFLASCSAGWFALGRFSQQEHTAVGLQTPFSMRLLIEEKHLDFERLIVTKDPTNVAPTSDTEVFSVREVKSALDIVPVGYIVAQKPVVDLSWPWRWISAAFGDEVSFDWHGHQYDYSFTESFIDPETVHRFYKDGCVLEYKVTKSRSSDPSSFKWIKSVH
jgi:hypothetical protein